MMNKDHIDNFLKVNHISTSTEEKKLKEALLYAKWSEKDVEIAMMTMRDKQDKGDAKAKQKIDVQHQMFRGDTRLAPEAISSLLGIDVTLNRESLREQARFSMTDDANEMLRTISLVVISCFIAVGVAFGIMYMMQVGPFYTPFEQTHF